MGLSSPIWSIWDLCYLLAQMLLAAKNRTCPHLELDPSCSHQPHLSPWFPGASEEGFLPGPTAGIEGLYSRPGAPTSSAPGPRAESPLRVCGSPWGEQGSWGQWVVLAPPLTVYLASLSLTGTKRTLRL